MCKTCEYLELFASLPDDFTNFMNVSSIVLSTAERAPGMRLRATAIPPFARRSLAPGCVSSILCKKTLYQVRYLQEKAQIVILIAFALGAGRYSIFFIN